MRRLLFRWRTSIALRILAQTSFCDDCSAVCTPDCRREGVRSLHRDRALAIGMLPR